jgi:hypothetical protein
MRGVCVLYNPIRGKFGVAAHAGRRQECLHHKIGALLSSRRAAPTPSHKIFIRYNPYFFYGPRGAPI